MTDKEINIAIAESVGWKDCHESENWAATIGTLHEVDGNQYAVLPDYLNDLNAMHEVELSAGMFEETKESRDRLLKYIRYIKENHNLHWSGHATARQRAEAYLKTLKLWKND